MKYRISDLMEHMEDMETYPNQEAYDISGISTERIKEKTMEKIKQNKKKRRIRFRQALLVAAVVSALAVTATAVAHRVNVRKLEAGEILTSDFGQHIASDGESLIKIDTQTGGKVVCCRPGWVPEDAKCLDMKLAKFTSHLSYYADKTGMDRDEVLKTAGLTEEEAENWYTSFWNEPTGNELSDGTKGSGRFFRVDLYSGATLSGKDLIMEGDTKIVREGELKGMTAYYLTEKASGVRARTLGDMNYILLYSEKMNCLIDVMGQMDFDELEKIATGLELKQTGLDALEGTGGYSLFSAGVG